MTDHKKPGVAFWITVILAVLLLVSVLAAMSFGVHYFWTKDMSKEHRPSMTARRYQLVAIASDGERTILSSGHTRADASYVRDGLARERPNVQIKIEREPDGG